MLILVFITLHLISNFQYSIGPHCKLTTAIPAASTATTTTANLFLEEPAMVLVRKVRCYCKIPDQSPCTIIKCLQNIRLTATFLIILPSGLLSPLQYSEVLCLYRFTLTSARIFRSFIPRSCSSPHLLIFVTVHVTFGESSLSKPNFLSIYKKAVYPEGFIKERGIWHILKINNTLVLLAYDMSFITSLIEQITCALR